MSAPKQNLVAAVAIALSCLLAPTAHAQFERDPAVLKAYQTGVAALEAESWDAAIEAFDQAIAADDGTFAELHFGRGEALRELEDYQNAVKSYTNAVQVKDSFAQAYNGRGICFREQGDLGLAFNDFQNAAELDRNDSSIAANFGDALVNNANDPTQAMQYLDRAIELDAENAEAYRNRGWAHTLLREFEEGIEDLNKATELDPTDYETYQRLASVHLAEEDYQLSIEALSKAIENYEPEKSSDPDTYINGYLQRAATRMTLAKEDDKTPEQNRGLYQAIITDAEAVLEEFPDRYPESGLALYRLGTAQRMQGLFAKASISFTDAIQMVPAGTDGSYVGEAYLLRGICWFYQDQNELARGDFKEAASKSLDDPRPYLWIGYTQAKEGKYRKAIESYGEAAARNPNYSLAYVNRGLAYIELKDYKKAVVNFNQAIRAEPTEPKHFYKRGRTYEMLGDTQKALDSYNLALLRDSSFSAARQGASRAMQGLGRPGLGHLYQNQINQ